MTTRIVAGPTIGGKYAIRGVLGVGGMATVYDALNVALEKEVAIKVLRGTDASEASFHRFMSEARAAAAIAHPNVCEVYDLGALDDGTPYMVMEKLAGETLADRIGRVGGLRFEHAIDVISQVLAGLEAAHAKRIIHRDIKPENMFLSATNGPRLKIKLLDFGVSKLLPAAAEGNEDLGLTAAGKVMGTPAYMSPEQARGDRVMDARVDLFACGIILYEVLTGKRPFIAPNYNALLVQILTVKPRPARELRPALPEGFDPVLKRALSRAKEKRYQTAREFRAAIEALRDPHAGAPPLPMVDAAGEARLPLLKYR